ncbi:monosaccharide ABC transporter substrate-binding protein (CUT2 family) [Haloactinopolyspora alba]|uniref:Monosaccharide ABC transporter substrate-binding protein (CUT2 family) n=1 Tax=Haloactinopolyspora alba TaxID=648780 RepID=A0A2P8DZV6_9ACTN|nr:sugar ABC transporter substrate-binding protein [Haloactinopolyspora alba]PSL02739.1 monosaccharide ABC transporter substrate-binding protein (CUT2 family) [Haloactinopolyspora alba]
MARERLRQRRALAGAMSLLVVLAACSSSGGREAEEENQQQGGGGGGSGPTEHTIAFVTHEAPGDTFWTIVRNGAEEAAKRHNVELVYSNSPEAAEQANLVQNAIDSEVDGIAVTMSKPDAMGPAVQRAVDAGIPVVALNAGQDAWQQAGASMFFGQDETVAGEAAGQRLSEAGVSKVLCVIHEQGSVSLEARCNGAAATFSGTMEKLYVDGTDMPSVRSTIQAKLAEDPNIERVLTLGAPFAMTAVQSVADAGADAQVVTFDTNAELVDAIKSGDVLWAVDQQPYLQGYLAVSGLWLNVTNGNEIGGGRAVLTGPSFVTQENIDEIAQYAERGTR